MPLSLHRWALPFVCAAIALGFAACAREPGLPAAKSRVPVNAMDLLEGMRCVDQCKPDYGSGPVDCAAAEAGLEFFPVPVWDFEGSQPTALYDYTDKTSDFLADTNVGCGVDEVGVCSPYQPTPTPIERCGQMTNAVHVRGGPFREWGAGIGRRLAGLAQAAAQTITVDGTGEGGAGSMPMTASCPNPPDDPPLPGTPSFCPKRDPAIDNAPGRTLATGADTKSLMLPNTSPQRTPQAEYYAMQVDLREWEGISFWARRGPDSQAGFRVVVGDRNTDDDIAFLENQIGLTPRCRRHQECGGGARLLDGSPDPQSKCRAQDQLCLPGAEPHQTWCWNPAYQPSPSTMTIEEADIRYDRCGTWACDRPYPAFGVPDLLFTTPDIVEEINTAFDAYIGTNTCARYTHGNDQTNEFCFDPVNGPPPAEGPERCGDNYMDPVTLTPDWQFFKVPFNELRQEGWAKRFPALDLSRVTVVRFTWSVGWVDYWIDDVRFYRRQK